MLLRKVGSTVVTALQQQDAANNGPFLNSKGRSNFGKPIGAPNDLITLADSNFLKTIATAIALLSRPRPVIWLVVSLAGFKLHKYTKPTAFPNNPVRLSSIGMQE
jgi:hypothetical protein